MPLKDVLRTSAKLPISGVVLAGGHSKRFGQDKASYIYKGKQMLDWSLESLSDTSEHFIIANRTYSTDTRIYADIRTNCSDTGCGPMGGLYTALNYAKNDWIALAACDMPNLNPNYWQTLYEQINVHKAKHAVVVQSSDSKLQTLAALYNKRLLPVIEEHLDNQTIALQSLKKYFTIIQTDALRQNTDLTEKLFLNFNYMEDIHSCSTIN